MPFIPDTDLPGARIPTGVDPTKPIPNATEITVAAFRQDNPIVNLAGRMLEERFPPVEGHNPLDSVRGTKFEQMHLDRFLTSQSPQEDQAIMRRIETEDANHKSLDAAGWAGTVAQIGAGMLDPTLALPGGAIVRGAKGGYSAVRSAALVGGAAGAQTAIAESVLQATQETRTAGETATAIGSATLLGAFIGAGAARLLTTAEREVLERGLDNVRADIEAHASGSPVPVAAGAAASDTRQLNLVNTGLGFTSKLSPTRDILSSSSVVARRELADLAETPYRFEGGEVAGNGPALSRIATMEVTGARVEVADNLDRLFSEYRFGDAETSFPRARAQFERLTGANADRMSFTDFKREISRALQEEDQHSIPQVAQAAQFIRQRVFEPWRARAQALGEQGHPDFLHFKDGALPKGAKSYFQRVYNKELINADRPKFVDRVTGWLKSDQATKAQAKERLIGFNRDLQGIEDALAKAKTEDRVVALTAERDALRTKIEGEIAAWEGKSVSDAKSAIKAREKYGKETARDPNAAPLESADTAIDRAVKTILEKDRDLDDAALRSRGQEITDRILSTPDGRLPYDVHMGGPQIGAGSNLRGPGNAREFAIPDALIRDYLENDVEQVVAMHLRTMVPDVLLTERFGDVRMTESLKRITEDYAAKIDAAGSEKARKALASERDSVIKRMAGVRDRIRGVYGWNADLRNMARVANGAKAFNNLTSMGVAAISSLPDMAGVVFRYGLSSTFENGWAPYFKHLTDRSGDAAFGKFKTQMRAMGIGVETAINARQHAIDDVMDVYRPQSRFERGLQAVNDKFFIANMLAPLTDFQKTIAAHVSVSEMLRATKAVAEGKATQKQLDNLAESSIDRNMAAKIWQEFQTGGEVIDGVHLPNTADWKDKSAAQALNGAVAREVDIAVVTPGQEKPLWMSQPVLGILGQFKSFTASATERILVANLQRRDANTLSGLMFSMGLGMLSYKLNALTGGSPTSERPQDWVKEGISRSGLLGWFEEGNALASKMTRGGVDIYRMIGADKPLTRFASRSTLDMLLGPTAGKITSLSQITGAAGSLDWGESDTKAVRRLTAGQNLFYFRNLLDKVEEGANGAFGIEIKPKP